VSSHATFSKPENYQLAQKTNLGQVVFVFHLCNVSSIGSNCNKISRPYTQLPTSLPYSSLLQWTFHFLILIGNNDTTESNFLNLDSHAIYKHMQLDKDPFLLTNRHGRNSLFMVPLRKFSQGLTISNIFHVCYFCSRYFNNPLQKYIIAELLIFTSPRHIENELERITQNGLAYIWTSKLISGTSGDCVKPYKETMLPATILTDIDGYFYFKTIVISLLFQSLKRNNSKSVTNLNHLKMDFPYVIAELSYGTHDDSFHRIVTETDSFNFIACHGFKKNGILSSAFIVKWGKPFDKTVWLLLIAGIAILPLISGLVLYAIKTIPIFKAC